MNDWTPPTDVPIHIVCAACRLDEFIAAGPRHFDSTMVLQVLARVRELGFDETVIRDWEEGFIDQWGRFYTREDAMEIVKETGQRFDQERNGGSDTVLYSEGLY